MHEAGYKLRAYCGGNSQAEPELVQGEALVPSPS